MHRVYENGAQKMGHETNEEKEGVEGEEEGKGDRSKTYVTKRVTMPSRVRPRGHMCAGSIAVWPPITLLLP